MNGINFKVFDFVAGNTICYQIYDYKGRRNVDGQTRPFHIKSIFLKNPATNTVSFTLTLSSIIGVTVGPDPASNLANGSTLTLAPGESFLLDAGTDGVINQEISINPQVGLETLRVVICYAHNKIKNPTV